MMRKLLLALMLVATPALSGCALAGLLGKVPTSPAAVADKTKLDEQTGLLVESLYTAATRAGALAFRAKIVKPSSNPAVQSDDFCPKVMARLFEPTDQGSRIMALECKLRAARDATRRAYDTANADSYKAAAAEATTLAREMLALISGD